ncbi:pilus assembly protein Flp/PilA [Arthrobacter pigmenti]|uniref:Pilus assembly protein Flp/PilA n=1 Tax=Arthrobacter pigmenti TaxID=271432 RepID=A0A846RSI2_9MICC|nr:Flp family type IVb pilin [Arthrobacter pigmenti]NJC23127.1 pilus assembly protein Flp/PilA [Arthrobacter pigmenti]
MLTSFFSDVKTIIKSRTNRDETGATAVEYGIMVALIAVVVIAAVTLLGGQLTGMFEEIACGIEGGTVTGAGTDAVACTP